SGAPMRFASFLLLSLIAFVSGCGWTTALSLSDDEGGAGPLDGSRLDFGRVPDGSLFDFGPPPDGGFSELGVDFGPRPCSSDAECNDGLVCDGIESCSGGLCLPGASPRCDDGIDCTVDTCAESSGGCTNVPRSTLCPPGQVCRGGVGCVAVACMTSLDCS